MNADEILNQIDHALEDHSLGPDAMRWTPTKPASQPTPGGYPDPVFLDESHVWVRPPTDLQGAVSAAQRYMRENGVSSWTRPRTPPPPGAPIAIGFDGSRDGDDAFVAAYRDELGRVYLHSWLTAAPEEGAC